MTPNTQTDGGLVYPGTRKETLLDGTTLEVASPGMTLLDAFALQAPKEPLWDFKPAMPDMPTPPPNEADPKWKFDLATQVEVGSWKGTRGTYSLADRFQDIPTAAEYEKAWRVFFDARDEWYKMEARQKIVQWPYEWAKQMIVARGLA